MRITVLYLFTIRVLVRKKNGCQENEKSYGAPVDKGKWKALGWKKTNGGGNSLSLKCLMYRKIGHRAVECRAQTQYVSSSTKPEHRAA